MPVPTAPQSDTWRDLCSGRRGPRLLLIWLGIWVGAAESLVTATIMPTVARQLGGYAYFSWAVALFMIGTILAVASAGRLAERYGLARASAGAGLVLATGCAVSALAPDIFTFLAGRWVQGVGGGWISGFAMVAVSRFFPERHLARVFASATAIWALATVLGPLLGGVFAGSGSWRGVFWLFSAQALLFVLAALLLFRGAAPAERGARVPWPQLGLLAVGVAALVLASLAEHWLWVLGLLLLSIGMLAWLRWRDQRGENRLLPAGAWQLRHTVGAGYAAMAAVTAASMALLIYGPPILQALQGLSPLRAGYVVAVQAMAWTLAALAVSGADRKGERRWIRIGALTVLLGVLLLAAVMTSPVLWVLMGAAICGLGLGWGSSLMNRRLLRALAEEDRAIGSSALIGVRQVGGAVGAVLAGLAANLAGVAEGLSPESAERAAPVVFMAVLPMALLAVWCAWRFTRSAD
ncbi:MFS transporter [Alloalcanivorax xenomutans]|uniref:MFS transporter n=1 Tax=Alloalcanivorax xenomutans TaxID=1094342 RepID=UPI001F3D703C|nr:MFS transporter [Alloalcanivorax xenomutans]MCE7525865.1 MFS transporter [Alloalcanivorax xenomutans]